MPRTRLTLLLTSCALAMTPSVSAQEAAVPILPAVFKVTGLQAGDHLNVRSGPSAKADDIGDLQSGSLVEVTAMDTNVGWAQIAYGEWSAWVYARYLTSVETPLIQGTDLPAMMVCGGTEPFWSFNVKDGTHVEFKMMGEASVFEPITYAGKSSNHTLRQGLQTAQWSAFLEKRTCSDGMSDRQMGISIELMSRETKQSTTHLSGCCGLSLGTDKGN